MSDDKAEAGKDKEKGLADTLRERGHQAAEVAKLAKKMGLIENLKPKSFTSRWKIFAIGLGLGLITGVILGYAFHKVIDQILAFLIVAGILLLIGAFVYFFWWKKPAA